VDVAAEERAIRDATQRWSSVARRGDTTGMYAIYADDGVWLRPGSIPMLNRDSLRAHLAGSVEPPPSDSLVQPQETMRVVVAKSGDLAYELGRFTNPAGAPVAGGFYIRVWRKDGGQWKLLATAPRAYAPDKGRLIAR
jgi:uncharacterized protein (TIGR02246 family)